MELTVKYLVIVNLGHVHFVAQEIVANSTMKKVVMDVNGIKEEYQLLIVFPKFLMLIAKILILMYIITSD